jgi:hypothetical protein
LGTDNSMLSEPRLSNIPNQIWTLCESDEVENQLEKFDSFVEPKVLQSVRTYLQVQYTKLLNFTFSTLFALT